MGRYVNTSSQGCHRETHSILFTSSQPPRRGRGRWISSTKKREREGDVREDERAEKVSADPRETVAVMTDVVTYTFDF